MIDHVKFYRMSSKQGMVGKLAIRVAKELAKWNVQTKADICLDPNEIRDEFSSGEQALI